MAARIPYDDVAVGTQLPAQRFVLQRITLMMYCGASGDFNVIHWNERLARAVGLPDVIAHGMLTMAEAGRVVTDWLGDPGALEAYSVRFTRPVAVPDDDAGAVVEVSGEVTALLDDRRVAIDLTATCRGQTVLGKARAVARLS